MRKEELLKRFIKYVKIDTQSSSTTKTVPSTLKQLDLIKELEQELLQMGLNPIIDKFGFLSLKIESNVNKKVDSIGFLAHVDTSPDYNGENVNPQIIENYQGNDILFKDGTVFSPLVFPELLEHKNMTLITTDGTSLLGSDDKAGVTIMMEIIKTLVNNKDIKHGDLYFAFTLDEEIGTGVDNFALDFFKPDFAYTIDGGQVGELNYETFNAAKFDVEISGVSVHPGFAKNKMVNALEIAYELHSKIPGLEKPEYTSGYEGFYLLMNVNGNVEKANLNYIIRDHQMELFEHRKNYLVKIIEELRKKYPQITIKYNLEDQYYNMRKPILENDRSLILAKKAMELNTITPIIEPIRGGTDGSKLSFRGIPCPNLFTG